MSSHQHILCHRLQVTGAADLQSREEGKEFGIWPEDLQKGDNFVEFFFFLYILYMYLFGSPGV